jgi:FixJ family two-component response regulator
VPKKPVISIVDDDDSVREGTMDLFNAMGLSAVVFPRADDFLKSNHLRSTCCVIADVQMPGMTGLDLHDCLIESGILIPTILITAYPDDRDRVRALAAGVICCLAKPYNQDELLSCVRSALGSCQARGRES